MVMSLYLCENSYHIETRVTYLDLHSVGGRNMPQEPGPCCWLLLSALQNDLRTHLPHLFGSLDGGHLSGLCWLINVFGEG